MVNLTFPTSKLNAVIRAHKMLFNQPVEDRSTSCTMNIFLKINLNISQREQIIGRSQL